MTRAEYLEFIEESMGFPTLDGFAAANCVAPHPVPELVLRDTPEVCDALRMAHHRYCAEVEIILFPGREAEVRKELMGIEDLAKYEAQPRDTTVVQPPLTGMSTGLIDAIDEQGDAVAAQDEERRLQAEHSIVS